MQTSVACPKCGRSFDVPPELWGKRLRCLECHHVFAAGSDAAPETHLQTVPSSKRRRPPEEAEDEPVREEQRFRRTDQGVPGYLWPLAAFPWALLLFALGGCFMGILGGLAAAVLSGIGIALVQARQWPVSMRLAGLLILDGAAGLLLLIGVIGFVIAQYSGPRANPGQAGQGTSALPPARPAPLPPPQPLFTNGPRVYLADLPQFGVQSGLWPFRKDGRNGDGRPIQVNGKHSPKGLSMHPPTAPAFATVRYRLGKQAALFRAVVAINDTSKWCWSPATFTVLGDGKPLWQSAWIAHNHAHTQECNVDVSGVDVLELRVQVVNGNQGVHAVWVEPRLLQKADTPDQ